MPDGKDLRIEWRGEILSDIGYGLQARRILKPLIDAGVDVKLIQAEHYIPEERQIKDLFWLEQLEKSKDKEDAPIRICYEIPPVAEYKKDAFNICYAMWESNKYPREWIGKINGGQAFIAGCPGLIDSAKNAGVKVPIGCIMPPLDTDVWCPEGPKTGIAGVESDNIVFMVNANWIPRKNFADLMTAFCCAFNGVKDVVLVIKTWGGNNSAEFKKQIKDNVHNKLNGLHHIDRPKVLIISDLLPEEQIIKLMRRADVYTTVSHGEGFDLPMVQAMSLGKICVATRFLGHDYYMTERNSIAVDYSLMPIVDAQAPGYTADQMWSRPNMEHYMECLQRAYKMVKDKSGQLEDMQEHARSTIQTKFNNDTITEDVIKTIRTLAKPALERECSKA